MSEDWKHMTADEKIEWLKGEVDDLTKVVERLTGNVEVTDKGVRELKRAVGKNTASG